MNKQQLATRIWEFANEMRSKIEANEYKDYILGFIFYKFLSDREVCYLKKQGFEDANLPEVTEQDADIVQNLKDNIGYFIPYENLFSTWLKKGNDFSVSNVSDALKAFSERGISTTHKKVFDGIFKTLQMGLSKLGDTVGNQTKAIRNLINLIRDIPMDGTLDYDVLGFIYEYLIGNFAAYAGKKAGEFYTPHEVSLFMSEIIAHHLQDRSQIKIYDPTSGSGSLLINIGKCVARHAKNKDQIKYYAQELKENTYNLTRMNLVMRGILPDNIVARNGDTLERDWPYFDENDPANSYDPLYVDAVVSNPPYSQKWDPANKENDARFSRFGISPRGKADYAFLLHDLYHLKADGIMTIVLPHGVLFRGGEEETIRRNLVEQNHIDAIVGLPANIFFGTGIPTIVMILKQKRETDDILIVDASKGFEKAGKKNVLRARDIKKIVDVVLSRTDAPKYARVVGHDEIRANGYNLNIPRYVDSSEKPETWDIFSSMFGGVPENELADYAAYWNVFHDLKGKLFTAKNDQYWTPARDDIVTVVSESAAAQAFDAAYQKVFDGFEGYLETELIIKMKSVDIAREEGVLSNAIFTRLASVPLVDKYQVYQSFADAWKIISLDLEMIQVESFACVKQVDPNMIIKKVKNQKVEVQDGWVGHILPFDLVQREYFKARLDALTNAKARLEAIPEELDALFGELSEEDKSGKDFIKGEGEDETFDPAEVKKALKAKDESSEVLAILKKAMALLVDQTEKRRFVKTETAALEDDTKAKIESLSDEEARELLKKKWIKPLVADIAQIPNAILTDFAQKMEALSKKYETTFVETEAKIDATEAELARQLAELSGSDFDLQGVRELRKLLGVFPAKTQRRKERGCYE